MTAHGEQETPPGVKPLTVLDSPAPQSVLSLACDATHIFAGTSPGIDVWEIDTFELKTTLLGHSGGVLCLEIASEKAWLFSSSSDNSVRIWSTKSLSPLFIVDTASSGDIFSLAWVPSLHTLYMGSQDATISWVKPPTNFGSHTPGSNTYTPRYHRFFDSSAAHEITRSFNGLVTRSSSGSDIASSPPAVQHHLRGISPTRRSSHDVIPTPPRMDALTVCETMVHKYAHVGYVYALAIARLGTESVLVSGSGDEDIKVWTCDSEGIKLRATLSGESDAVLTLVARDSTIFAGHQGGCIKIWDLETLQCIRTIKASEHDILCLSVLSGDLFAGDAAGYISRWSKDFGHLSTWKGHEGITLASRAKTSLNSVDGALVTGSSDNTIKIWDVSPQVAVDRPPNTGLKGRLFTLLSQFITYRTVSSDETREECRQGALWLKRTLAEMGASTSLLPGAPHRNPLVLATFNANAPGGARKRVLFYGHYDVVKPGPLDQWTSDPFELSARNEYIYARGVTDNKGPILAVACATAQLVEARELAVDVVLLIEGEEEANSTGFREAVKQHRDHLGPIDVVLLSNSSSILGKPCVTWGLRGVIRASVEVVSSLPDTHSGLSGGAVSEPLVDLIRLLGSLTDLAGRVTIPSFYDSVRPLSSAEAALYDAVAKAGPGAIAHSHITDTALALRKAWREPALSYHKVDVSGPAHATVIPYRARATVSIRIVPDQPLETIASALVAHCRHLFAALQSPNTLEVSIKHKADWWLGDPGSRYSVAMADIVEQVWGAPPLWIREGGSIPGVALLERELEAEAVHLPMGGAADAAHLPNERIRIVNLEKGMLVVRKWLEAIAV